MLHKCANPVCSTRFLRLRDGKLFQVETEFVPNSSQTSTLGRPRRQRLRHVEYYWLCNQCAPYVTLVSDPTQGVITIPLPEGVARRTVTEKPSKDLGQLTQSSTALVEFGHS